jgi:hypothetical protein
MGLVFANSAKFSTIFLYLLLFLASSAHMSIEIKWLCRLFFIRVVCVSLENSRDHSFLQFMQIIFLITIKKKTLLFSLKSSIKVHGFCFYR